MKRAGDPEIEQAIEDGEFVDDRVDYADRELLTTPVRGYLHLLDLTQTGRLTAHPRAFFLSWFEREYGHAQHCARADGVHERRRPVPPAPCAPLHRLRVEGPRGAARGADGCGLGARVTEYFVYAVHATTRERELKRLCDDTSEALLQHTPPLDESPVLSLTDALLKADANPWAEFIAASPESLRAELIQHERAPLVQGEVRLERGTHTRAPHVLVVDGDTTTAYEIYTPNADRR